MPKFFRLESKLKSDDIKIEGETLPPSPSNDADLKKAVDEVGTEGEGLQLNSMNSRDVGKKGKETGSKEDVVDADDGVIYPNKKEVGIITLALILAVFMVALDQTIIATAIPHITDQFDSLGDVGWYGSAYLLTSSAFQLFFGRLYVLFPVKWIFVLAVALFALGSVISGAAPTSAALIVGRAISGFGCAGMMSGALVIIAHAVPLRQRPIYTGIVGAFNGVASVVGPLLGGAFTDHVTWRWCFYINLPFSGLTIGIITFFFKSNTNQASTTDDPAKDPTKRGGILSFDPLGTLCLVPAIICLLLALQWGGSTYAWNSARVIALLVLFAVLILGFIVTQYFMQSNATVPPRIIKQRSIGFGALYAFCSGAALFIITYYLPMFFQVIKNTSAFKSGIDMLPLILSLTVMSLLAGGFVTAIGYYVPAMILGSVLKSVGSGLISTLNADTNHKMWIGSQILFGFGGGLGVQQAMIAAHTVLSLKDLPSGIAIINFAQTMGAAVFISVAQNVFATSLISNLKSTVPEVDPLGVLNAGATNIRITTDPQYMEGVLLAYSKALNDTYHVAIAMAAFSLLGALGMEWRSVKGQKVNKKDANSPASTEA